ncbi:D-2-hydroxyacid dehydrogenase [Vibrio sp. WJH972]
MKGIKDKFYLLTDANEEYQTELKQYDLPGLEQTDIMNEATVVIADPPLAALHLDKFDKLEWLQSTYAGVDKLMLPELRQDYTLTNVKGVFGPLIAEYVIGYLIQHYRHFQQYREHQSQQQWSPMPYQSLQGKRMVILGTGVIAKHLAKVVAPFGIDAIGINRSGIPPKDNTFSAIYHFSELEMALKSADIVVSTLPNTPETKHMLNREFFSWCDNVVLFNVGRGANLAEDSLISAIDSGQVGHAYLDVFEQEPLNSHHPFWHHPNITITPHIAALSFPRHVIKIFATSYQRWSMGQMPQFVVDFSKGY